MKFEVVGIERKSEDQWQVRLEGHFHRTFSSQIFLSFATKEEAARFPLGMELELGPAPQNVVKFTFQEVPNEEASHDQQ